VIHFNVEITSNITEDWGYPLRRAIGSHPLARFVYLAGAKRGTIRVGVAGRNRPAEEGREGGSASAAREETSSPQL
jgi:hypothetical protein